MKQNQSANNIFKAIADPTRREIFYLLVAATTALSINSIASSFVHSRQAITKHIEVLSNAGLVQIEKKGREKYCFPNPKPLKEVHDWLSTYQRFWDSRLDMLENFLGGIR